MAFNIGDLVNTTRLEDHGGKWEVLDKRGTGSGSELHLKNTVTAERRWLYEAHCWADVRMKCDNSKRRRTAIEQRANKILSKPIRKR